MLLAWMPVAAAPLPIDTVLTRCYDKAADFLSEGEFDSAQYYFDRAFAVKGVEESPVYPILLNEQGTLYSHIGENDKAIAMKKAVMKYLPQVDDLEKHVSVYHDLGICYRRKNRNDSALHYYNKALEAALRYRDESWLALLNLNLAILHFNLRHVGEAEKYVEQAVAHLAGADDPYMEVGTWQVRSSIKAELGQMDEARSSIRRAWAVASGEQGNRTWQMRCIPSLLSFYSRCGREDSVDYFLDKGEQLWKLLPQTSIVSIGFAQAKADVCFRRGNYKETMRILKKLLDGGSEGNMRHTAYHRLAVCSRNLGNMEAAYVYMDSARIWTDSLAQEKLTNRLAELDARFHTQEKELEITRLHEQSLEQDALWMKTVLAAGALMAVLVVLLLVLLYKRRLARAGMERLRQEAELTSARKYIEGLESERKRFARELHDGIANDLLGLQLRLGAGEESSGRQGLEHLVADMRENVRRISHELMPPEFSRLSLDVILARYLAALEHDAGIHIVYSSSLAEADWRRIPHEVAYEVYRIVQELAANILKHSGATVMRVSLTAAEGGRYELKMEDNGRALAEPDREKDGIGLHTIGDRVRTIGAVMEVKALSEGNVCTLVF